MGLYCSVLVLLKAEPPLLNTQLLIAQSTYCSSPRIASAEEGGFWIKDNDPSAGSPTETLLRLLLPLNDKICLASRGRKRVSPPCMPSIQKAHRIIQSVGATGGVYKGQGRSQRKLVTCAY
jgi:hypothetical protein